MTVLAWPAAALEVLDERRGRVHASSGPSVVPTARMGRALPFAHYFRAEQTQVPQKEASHFSLPSLADSWLRYWTWLGASKNIPQGLCGFLADSM